MAELSLAKVIINISHESVDRPFTYIIPESLKVRVNLGSAVSVPFGAGNTLKKGYVVELTDHTDVAPEKLKEIADVPDKDISLSDKRIALAAWMKRNYGSTMIAALKTVIPIKEKVKESVKKTVVRKKAPEEIEEYIAGNKSKTAQLRLLNALLDEERIPKSILDDKLHILASTYKKLEELGFIEIEEERIVRGAVSMNVAHDSHMKLSPAQQTIVDEVRDDFDKNIHKTYLIHGITGSGKTEVYMQIIDDVIGRGRQAIVLIPEISLTYQTLMRFYKRFGDRVCVMNSTLSKGEKYDIYRQAIEGEVDIVIGPRSALFTPFNNLGVIIIDEEHEGTYKSETMPKYHARETAIELARMNNASVILGSATPSIDSYYRAKNGEYKLFTLTERLTGNQLPNVIVSDLRKELREGNRSILSRDLQELIEDRLNKNEQIMLFLNRRGMAGFVSCRACGFVVKCPHCDVSLSLHRNGKLVCHYCGYTTDNYKNCPKCGSKYILGFKAGTEQVEEIVQKMYPKARTLRMDADTTKKKESYEEILSRFLDQEADILIGTQMIVKGHDFKNVTLMGVLAADMSLFAADYRAPEKTFDLLTQAAGRAGRGDKPGDVVIQTYQPDHYAISFSVDQDYEGFYEEEIGYRDLMDYPPAAHMLSVLVTGADEKACEALAANLAMGVREHFKTLVIGPAPASVSKINDVYRQVFYLKHKSYDALVEIKDFLEAALSMRKQFKESVFFDFDPQNGY
ncbi:MAG: primosomal protein N' [Lachnospiraceae bacterium]|nr:primosomal protein N' [Lachnospiraceae bacterium]